MELASVNELTKLLTAAGVRASAVGRAAAAIFDAKVSLADVPGFLDAMRTTKAVWFDAPAQPPQDVPTFEEMRRQEAVAQAWFIANIHRLAGPSAPAQAEEPPTREQAPKSLSASSPTFGRDFATYVAQIADGSCQVVP